jgi:peptide/nickel transport system permease protein
MIRRALASDLRVIAAAVLFAVLAALALGAPYFLPFDPLAQGDILASRFRPPMSPALQGGTHWLGTDELGRDLLARLAFGARISLLVGFASVGLAVALGALVGLTAAVAGGAVERALMAVTDAALAMPRLVLLLALVAIWQPSLVLVVLVLGFTGWMGIARLVRADVRSVLQQPFVEAARAAGVGTARLVLRHLVPNALTSVTVAAALAVGNAIMLEAGLAFLGLGVPPPAPSWGNLIAGGRDALVNAPWIATLPGLAVALTVVACNLFADGVRDALDPRAAVIDVSGRGA